MLMLRESLRECVCARAHARLRERERNYYYYYSLFFSFCIGYSRFGWVHGNLTSKILIYIEWAPFSCNQNIFICMSLLNLIILGERHFFLNTHIYIKRRGHTNHKNTWRKRRKKGKSSSAWMPIIVLRTGVPLYVESCLEFTILWKLI